MPKKSSRRHNKLRHDDIRRLVLATSRLQHAEKQRIKWSSHLMRMTLIQPNARVFHQRTTGHTSRGRPPTKKRWVDGAVETLANYGVNFTEATHGPKIDTSRCKRKAKVKCKEMK